jgi:hypothetical protein
MIYLLERLSGIAPLRETRFRTGRIRGALAVSTEAAVVNLLR